MARDGWFDGQGVDLFKNALDKRKKEWEKYIADGKIDENEIKMQKAIIINKLKRFENELGDAQHRKLTDILIDYELLVSMLIYPKQMPADKSKGRYVSREKKSGE